ncbi:endolytic transglycosylase MltG [Treponema zuelzerae]|uniref:Endolytic murein transglycosylase n=1 Tax=Teretinema zuelzerae TaxID=156 RepID=A0AAE3EH87_9SPIR|nr:endolytic transglycosylase MltG [Teretinema zuelzerae]MCD1654587.1 endolytic transglycosylase MltG [Teretinema zuelzerae]HPO02175.1 endolytic transglycosylase MltG [Treponemataceae bacterium]
MKRILLFVAALSVLSALSAGAGFIAYSFSSVDPASEQSVLFQVSRGQSVASVCQSLEESGLVRSALISRLHVRLYGLTVKAGTYRLSPSQNTQSIIKTLSDGKQETKRVTIPEGLTLGKVASYLESQGFFSRDDFIQTAKDRNLLDEFGIAASSAEGYLFPDTYFFPLGADSEIVVRTMLRTFFSRISALEDNPESAKDLHERIIMASIVEREYRLADEAPLIASVFANRLKIGMGLQSCATIEYIITEIEGKAHPSRLLVSDLEIPNDFNTYLWAGLPPGPICSPGLVAIKAAFSYPSTPYLYFRLTDPDTGRHSFTRSLEEHVQAGRQLYLKKAAGK